jgi:cytochrome c-type biogenesis protein CcmH
LSVVIGKTRNGMAIWFILIGMTAAVVAVLLIPFRRRTVSRNPGTDADFAATIYRDQLSELDRDHARDLIGETEAAAARNEISRRLLQASAVKTPSRSRASSLAKFAVIMVPLIALPLYVKYGAPSAPDVPLQERLKGAIANQDLAALVATVEAHLAEKPDDREGWAVLAPIYKREKRWGDAAEAFANMLRLAPPTADAMADYGEMLVFANQGMVTAEAQKIFEEALKLDAKNPRSRFFDALAIKQEGKSAEARKLFTDFLNESPADAPWRTMVETELADLQNAKAPALSNEQIATVEAMPESDQATMIKGMIDGLEERLGKDSRDLQGWLRLIRARSVSKEGDKARSSLQLALGIFKNEPASLQALQGLATELGIN